MEQSGLYVYPRDLVRIPSNFPYKIMHRVATVMILAIDNFFQGFSHRL